MNGDHDSLETSRLIELTKERRLIDSAEMEGSRYRVKIGAARFLLDRDGTREFLIKLLRSQRPRHP